MFLCWFSDDGDDGVFVADDDDELLLVDALDGGEDPELEVGGQRRWTRLSPLGRQFDTTGDTLK